MYTEDYLKHYGKLGMKWGRRSGGVNTKTLQKIGSSKATQAIAKGGVKTKKAILKTAKGDSAVQNRRKVKQEKRKEALTKNYGGKTYGDHAVKALAGYTVANLAGGALMTHGKLGAGLAVANIGSLAVTGNLIGNMYNQAEYNRKYSS